ncbi:MAG: hypothetical protein NUW01_08855 [Gemmatimonadaceae bacterium]|nr:hypothetical protein [Gemmatimonadaceae bacterium]
MNRWIEVRLNDVRFIERLYIVADRAGVESIHHFWEPWHSDGPVVRILNADEGMIAEWLDKAGAGSFTVWDASPDERQFGDKWPTVFRFFEAASRLYGADVEHEKLVHCAFNAWGYGVKDERNFALNFAARRRRMLRHDRLYTYVFRNRRCRYGCHPVAE